MTNTIDAKVGDNVTLHVWGGAGHDEVTGTIEAIEANDDYDGDPVVILAEDDAMAYFLSQVIRINLPAMLSLTANGYLVCAAHLARWRAGGNDVHAWPIPASEVEPDAYECADCSDDDHCDTCGASFELEEKCEHYGTPAAALV